MKKKTIFLIIGLSLAVVSAIALPGYPDRAPNSLWKAIKAGTAMEPGGVLPEVATEPNQR
jgi:hypothetical protein